MTLLDCLAGTVLVERLELKWLIHVLRFVTVVYGIRDGSVEDIPQCQMALFCVLCVLHDTAGAVITQPSSVFETVMDFTFISCHLSSSIIFIIIVIIDVTYATVLAMGLNCQQLRLQVERFASSFTFLLINVNRLFDWFDCCVTFSLCLFWYQGTRISFGKSRIHHFIHLV